MFLCAVETLGLIMSLTIVLVHGVFFIFIAKNLYYLWSNVNVRKKNYDLIFADSFEKQNHCVISTDLVPSDDVVMFVWSDKN